MIEKLLQLISPDECVVCAAEGQCLCTACEEQCLLFKKLACVFCNELNEEGQICRRCKSRTNLAGAKIAYRYDGVARELIARLKYTHQRSIAEFFACRLPQVPLQNPVVSFVACDGPARRARGFDQAELLAKNYAKKHQLEFRKLLLRSRHTHQVGHNRQQRFENVVGNFTLRYKEPINQPVILVDDVITTGATINECAKQLNLVCGKPIWAVAVAKK